MPGRHSRNKGARFEREVVHILKAHGYIAERVPLSGAMGTFKGDIQAVLFNTMLRMECKTLANGFKFLYGKLADNGALLLKADRHEPLIVFRLAKLLELLNDLHHSGDRDQPQRVAGDSEAAD